MKKKKEEISLNYDLEPIAFLEGSKGLDNMEKFIYRKCQYRDIDCWLLDELYVKPDRVYALKYLNPKTLVIGTTGVYKEKLDKLIEIFFSLEITSVENIILVSNSEEVLHPHFEKLPNVNFLKPVQNYSPIFDDIEKDEVSFYKIEI